MNSTAAADSTNQGAKGKAAQESKPKRVRTGCLTCRDRHLKCDEGTPICNNCQKSNRECIRGIRVNFLATECEGGHHFLPAPANWQVAFLDESREIAREYKGGLELYPTEIVENEAPTATGAFFMATTAASHPGAAAAAQHPLPPIQSMQQPLGPEGYPEAHQTMTYNQAVHSNQQERPVHMNHHNQSVRSNQQERPIHVNNHGQSVPAHHGESREPLNHHDQLGPSHLHEQLGPSHHHTHSRTESVYSGSTVPTARMPSVGPNDGPREYLDNQEEVLFMQVFVEEVGLWMDSMDPMKHFSRLLPFHALREPMLLNAFLACGARHLSLVNTKYTEDKALYYYDTATRYLLNSLQNPDRDVVICATTAVILNVYEIMSERALQRMNHIAGARALIKECGWNARSSGIGAACFWLNVGMELLSCLHFNWQVAWDPEDWGLDMDFSHETQPGREEIWTYRIVYIVAKIANFRASIPRDSSPRSDPARLQKRYEEWKNLRHLADEWNAHIPRSMHPMGYLHPGYTISGSAFPEVWLIKRTSIVARLFYHTAMCLLAQINPVVSPEEPEMKDMQMTHSRLICGISAHVKDRGVASVALRSLHIAAECLTNRREQEEVLQIFHKIRQETGWRVGFVFTELKEKWGWNDEAAQQAQQQQDLNANGHVAYQQQPQQYQQAPAPTSLPPAPPQHSRRPTVGGIINPLLASADFSLTQHPYQNAYVPPNTIPQAATHHFYPPSY